ncbi:hypothetical protein ACL9RI_25395 [Janthinobacterium sp. Mn2066]|uniref:hypothetical protein n=1 Tax=Janthinobacterium sp. Mn2066 TaxID=3395264 RepID=UPI003BE498C4
MDFADKVKLLAVAAAAVFVVILVKKKGAAAGVGEDLGHAAVDLAGGVATGVIDGVSTVIGIPTISELIRDPVQCRAYIDANGKLKAMGACTELAFLAALEPVQAVKEAPGNFWDWLTTPSASDYTLKPTTGAFDRQL